MLKSKPFFRHFLIEVKDSYKNTNSLHWLKDHSDLLIKRLNLIPIKSVYHKFKPQGISLVYILGTSHMAVHTWPENEYLHIDLITCSADKAVEDLETVAKEIFKNNNLKVNEVIYRRFDQTDDS